MADKTLEQMLEHLMNEDQATAEELFHEYVVKKSREIYENLIETELSDDDEEDVEESADNDEDDKDNKDDEKVEEGFEEADDEFGGDPTDDLAGDIDAGGDDEFGDDEFGDDEFAEKEPAELFQDLDAIVDELQAKFDGITGGGDEFGDDELEGDLDSEMPDDAFDSDDEEEIDDGFDQELATVREYVEKIGAPKMGDNGVNTKSTVAGKNDMGGTSANILKGGEAKGEGTKGGLADPGTKEENAGNINVPGGKAGKAFSKKEPGHGAEKKGAGEDAENKQSLFRNKR